MVFDNKEGPSKVLKRHVKRKLTKYLESKQLEKLRCNMFAEEKGNSIQETKEDFVASNF